MAGEEAPDKRKRANNIRYWKYVKMIKIERRLRRKIQEDPGSEARRPRACFTSSDPRGTRQEAMWSLRSIQSPRLRKVQQLSGEGGDYHRDSKPREGSTRRVRVGTEKMQAWPTPHPPPPSSWGMSSKVSEATAENQLGRVEKLTV